MLNAMCDLPSCEQPELEPDSTPTPSAIVLSDHHRAADYVMRRLGMTCVDAGDDSNGLQIHYYDDNCVNHVGRFANGQAHVNIDIDGLCLSGFVTSRDSDKLVAIVEAAREAAARF